MSFVNNFDYNKYKTYKFIFCFDMQYPVWTVCIILNIFLLVGIKSYIII